MDLQVFIGGVTALGVFLTAFVAWNNGRENRKTTREAARETLDRIDAYQKETNGRIDTYQKDIDGASAEPAEPLHRGRGFERVCEAAGRADVRLLT